MKTSKKWPVALEMLWTFQEISEKYQKNLDTSENFQKIAREFY